MPYYREDRHRWAIFQHFSATMEPSKKIKTNDMKTIICFILIRFSVGTKNVPTCLTARRRKSKTEMPTFRLFMGCAHTISQKSGVSYEAAHLH